MINDILTVESPFRDFVEEFLRSYKHQLSAEEDWVNADPKSAETATVAEKFDNTWIRKFYKLFPLGMFIRLLEREMEAGSNSSLFSSIYTAAGDIFTRWIQEIETGLDYKVIPIQKLVRIQLGSALIAAKHVARYTENQQ